MKTPLFSILTIAVLLCGCASPRSTGRTNGTLQINLHVPDDLAGHRVVTYFNGECLADGTGTTATFTLRPRRFKIRIEMVGGKPFEQTLDIAGNGSSQVLDVTLVKP